MAETDYTGSDYTDTLFTDIKNLSNRVESLEKVTNGETIVLPDGSEFSMGDFGYEDVAIDVYVQSTAPTGLNSSTDVGDKWIDTNDNDREWIWDGFNFIEVPSGTVYHGAYSLAALGPALISRGLTSFTIHIQTSAPASPQHGDVHRNDSDVNYYWNSDTSTWVEITDDNINQGIENALNDPRADISDGQLEVFYQTAAPGGLNANTDRGNLWFDTDDKYLKWTWGGTAWEGEGGQEEVQLTDGLPPSYSPTPTTLGGLGMIFLKWEAVSNQDFPTYEVHVSEDPTFVAQPADPATFLMETASTMVAAKHLADGTPFEYDVPPETPDDPTDPKSYYFSILAKDADGYAPAPSTVVAGSMDKTASGDIVAGAITAAQLDAVLALVSTISTRSQDADGNLTGAGTDMSTEGVYSYRSDGSVRFELPNDPLLPAVFRGDAEIDRLTVQSLTTLVNSELAEGATFTMQSSVVAPGNPPSIDTALIKYSFESAGGSWYDKWGWAADNQGHAYTYNNNTHRLEKWDIASGERILTGPPEPSQQSRLNPVWAPNDVLYVIRRYDLIDEYVVTRHRTTDLRLDPGPNGEDTFFMPSQWTVGGSDSNGNLNSIFRRPAIGWDYTNNRLIVARSHSPGDKRMRFYEFSDPDTYSQFDNTLNHVRNVIGSDDWGVHISTLLCGTFDMGERVYISGDNRQDNPWHVYRASDGVRQENLEWDSGVDGGGSCGMYWDGFRFWAMEYGGREIRYERDGNYWTTGDLDETWYGSYTWYDSGTGQETTRSPLQQFTMLKRRAIIMSGNAKPGGVTHARFYLKQTSNDSYGTSDFQGSSSSASPSIEITDADFSAVHDPTTNTFGGGVPANIVSILKRADGTAKFEADGSGAGRFDGLLPPGSMIEYGGLTAPAGWLLCDGSALSTAVYPDLFAAIGYQFGGSGTTFNLPDRRGRVGIGADTVGTVGPNVGQTGGSFEVHVNQEHTPPHFHDMTHDHPNATGGDHIHTWISESSNDDGIRNQTKRDGAGPGSAGFTTATADGGHSHNILTSSKTLTGDGSDQLGQTPLDTTPSYVGVNYIIKT